MPLPSVLNGANRCQVLTKRTRLPCKNPAAYGCKSCRMHGAHKSRNTLQGANHPQYRNGNETKGARIERSRMSTMFLYLRDIGDTIHMFTGPKTRGRHPSQYVKLDLSDPKQMAYALAFTANKKLRK